jgi:hypothetical protein
MATGKKNLSRLAKIKATSALQPLRIFIVLAIVIYLGWAYWLSRQYPIVQDSKDYLDILSAVGQAFGVFVLGGLLFEIYITRVDAQKKSMPDIFVTPSFVKLDQLPEDAFYTVNEEDVPSPSSDPLDQYHTYWESLNPEHRTHFVRLEIINRAKDLEGEARNLRFKLKVKFSTGSGQTKDRPAKEFWCPKQSLTIPTGERQVTLFVRCGLALDPKISCVAAEILDYECENRQAAHFSGLQSGFVMRSLEKKPFDSFTVLIKLPS